MAKKASASVLDGSLDVISQCTEMYICTSEPADRAAAIATSLVGAVVLTGGDFTKGAGTGTNRKVTIAQKPDIPITGTGDANHVVLCTAAEMRVVTTCTQQTLTAGGTVTAPSFEYEVEQPQ